MNITDDIKKNVIDHAAKIRELARGEQPSPVDWGEIKQYLDEAGIFLQTFVVDKITIAPRWSGTGPKIAEFTPPERSDLEMTPDDSAASLVRDDDPTRRFLAQGNGKA